MSVFKVKFEFFASRDYFQINLYRHMTILKLKHGFSESRDQRAHVVNFKYIFLGHKTVFKLKLIILDFKQSRDSSRSGNRLQF